MTIPDKPNGKNQKYVKMLLEAGADINAKDKDGKTALDYAKERKDKEIIDILLKHKAQF